jgi:predicted nucleic acid-binding protein
VIETYVLDSWAILALLQREEPAATRVRELLVLGEQQEAILLLSMINLGEVFYRIGKQRGRQQAERALALIRNSPLSLVSVSDEMVLQAAALKMEHRISYADAFAAALAIARGGRLVTGDPDFDALTTDVRLEKLQRSPFDGDA